MSIKFPLTFEVDKENRRIHVERTFGAPLDPVWAAWTEPELLDEWWAPKPWKSRTKSMDFREGGHRVYAMVGPEGETHWARTEYTEVDPKNSFGGRDVFAGEDGTENTDMPAATFTNVFRSDSEDTTTVIIDSVYPTLESLEATINMGFKEGFTMALENLDQVLSQSYRKQ